MAVGRDSDSKEGEFVSVHVRAAIRDVDHKTEAQFESPDFFSGGQKRRIKIRHPHSALLSRNEPPEQIMVRNIEKSTFHNSIAHNNFVLRSPPNRT